MFTIRLDNQLSTDSPIPPFDIETTAGLYSQLTGVLAGFAFTALILLLTARLTILSTNHPAASSRILIVAFIGLVLSSLDYALLAGDKGRPRAATLEIVGGMSFAISALLLVYAVILTISSVDTVITASGSPDPELKSIGNTLRGALALVLVPFALLLVYNGVQDYNRQKYDSPTTTSLDYLAWVLIGVQLIVGTALYFKLSKSSSHVTDSEIRKLSYIAFASLLGVSVIYSVIITTVLDNGLGNPAIPYICLLAQSVLSIGFVAHLARYDG